MKLEVDAALGSAHWVQWVDYICVTPSMLTVEQVLCSAGDTYWQGRRQTNFLCQPRCGKRRQEDRGLGTWHQTQWIIFDSKWKLGTGSSSKGDPFSLLLLFSTGWCGRQEHPIRKTSSRPKLAFKALQIVFTGNYINPRQLLSLFKWTLLAISSCLTWPFSKGSTCVQSSLYRRQQP